MTSGELSVRLRWPALLAATALICLAALAPSARADTGSITGTVTDAPTGEPLEGAEVCAETFAEEGGTFACGYTETDGTYFIGGLSPAQYRVQFWAGNQYEFEYFDGEKRWEDANPVAVVSGAQTSEIDADMDRTATIGGTVLAGGLGVEEVEACAYPLDPEEETYSRCGASNAEGAYSIKGLLPGSYKVEFWTGWTGPGYAFQFYDHKNRYLEADVVTVGEGEWREGVDADLAPGASISGRVSDLVTGVGIEVRVCSVDAASGRLTTCTWSEEDGAYVLGLLPAGDFKVVFSPEFWEFFPGEALPGEDDDELPTQFWNNQPTIGAAGLISLATGASVTGVDAKFARGSAPSTVVVPPVSTPTVRKHRKCRHGYRKKLVRGKRRCVKVRKHRKHRHKKQAARPTVRFSAR